MCSKKCFAHWLRCEIQHSVIANSEHRHSTHLFGFLAGEDDLAEAAQHHEALELVELVVSVAGQLRHLGLPVSQLLPPQSQSQTSWKAARAAAAAPVLVSALPNASIVSEHSSQQTDVISISIFS